MLWTPVALGFGGATYLALPTEPLLGTVLAPAALLLVLAVWVRRIRAARGIVVAITLATLFAGGLAAGKLRTMAVAAPIAPETGAAPISGWVIDVASPGQTGGRMVIAPTAIGDLPPDRLPALIRVTSRKGLFGPGAAVRFVGLINPPPPPASPGAYDFARNAWFDRIGGVGIVLTEPRIVSLEKPEWGQRARMAVNAFRWTLAQRIAARMSSGSAGLGAAMVTGHEAFIDTATEDALRDAGLAHIVSISGLHMAIVGGFAFLLFRMVIAWTPWLALRLPGKKIAAVAGLVAVATYLVISGSPPAAERAAITASIMFAAILADRQAISLHTLAIAALAVILLQPEAVGEAGFQMSFAATAALVALAEVWRGRVREINTPLVLRIPQTVALWVGVSLAASFVAGLATGPFAIQHFNRVASYGLLANLLTEPLSTFVIMPALALGAVFELAGIGAPFLAAAGWGIDMMNSLAGWVTRLPHSVLVISSAPAAALPIAFFGILWLCLWKGRGRWLGLPLAFAVALWPRPEPPVAWIDPEGAQVGVARGKVAVLMRPEDRLFAADLWARRRGFTLAQNGEGARDGVFDCGGTWCSPKSKDFPRISAWWTVRVPKAEMLERLCEADILVIRADVELPARCAGVKTLTAQDFVLGGAAEIYRDGRIVWTQPGRGHRPWTRVSGSGA